MPTLANVTPRFFRSVLELARSHDPRIDASCAGYEPVRGTRFYYAGHLSDDGRYGTIGYGIRPDGELVYAFSTIHGAGAGDRIVCDAIARGATHLNCFDVPALVSLYTRHGFREERREPNWTAGGPDVLYFRLTPAI